MKSFFRHYGNALFSGIKEISWLSLVLLSLSPVHVIAASNPDFWLAERGEQKLWLLGSIHVGSEDMYPLSSAIQQSWSKTQNLIVETDLNNSQDTGKILLTYALLPAHTNLSSQLDQALYQQTLEMADHYHLSESQIAHFRPWFVAINLQQQAIQHAGYKPSMGIDQYFIDQAHQHQISITYLETPEQQLSYLAGLGNVENDFLKATLEQINKVQTELPDLIKAWKNGDKAKLQTLLSEEDSSSPQLRQYLEQHLIKERNLRWLPQITTLKSSNNFMVVGAMHLYGDTGLLKLLKTAGYKLTNIKTR